MRKVMVVVWVWLLVFSPMVGLACEQGDTSCSQGQSQGQNQTSVNSNSNLNSNLNSNTVRSTNNNVVSNVNVVDPKQIMIVDIDGRVTYQPKNTNVNNVNPSAGSSSSASGGSATAYGGQGGQGGNASVVSNPSASSSANNSLTVVAPENKRPLPNIPDAMGVGQLEFRGPYGKGMYQFVAPWRVVAEWNPGMIEGFPSCVWNCDVELAKVERVIFDRNYFKVVKKSDKRLLGWIIIRATNPLEMWGKVAQYAFEMGVEEVVENAYQSTFSNKSGGWNVGIGGGATAISNGNDSVGGSFGGGTGFGSVETRPVEKCEAAFTFYGK